MEITQDVSSCIERHAAAERHFGVELTSLSAFLTREEDGTGKLAVSGELRATSGGALARSLGVLASAHDAEGRVLGVWKDTIGADGFFEVQAFSLSDYTTIPPVDVARIRVYPHGY